MIASPKCGLASRSFRIGRNAVPAVADPPVARQGAGDEDVTTSADEGNSGSVGLSGDARMILARWSLAPHRAAAVLQECGVPADQNDEMTPTAAGALPYDQDDRLAADVDAMLGTKFTSVTNCTPYSVFIAAGGDPDDPSSRVRGVGTLWSALEPHVVAATRDVEGKTARRELLRGWRVVALRAHGAYGASYESLASAMLNATMSITAMQPDSDEEGEVAKLGRPLTPPRSVTPREATGGGPNQRDEMADNFGHARQWRVSSDGPTITSRLAAAAERHRVAALRISSITTSIARCRKIYEEDDAWFPAALSHIVKLNAALLERCSKRHLPRPAWCRALRAAAELIRRVPAPSPRLGSSSRSGSFIAASPRERRTTLPGPPVESRSAMFDRLATPRRVPGPPPPHRTSTSPEREPPGQPPFYASSPRSRPRPAPAIPASKAATANLGVSPRYLPQPDDSEIVAKLFLRARRRGLV